MDAARRPHITDLKSLRDRSPEKLRQKLADMEEEVVAFSKKVSEATSDRSRELYGTKLRKAEVRRAWLQNKLGLPVTQPGSALTSEASAADVLLEGFEGMSVQPDSAHVMTAEERVEMETKYGDKPPEELQKWSGVAEKVIQRCEEQLNEPESLLEGQREELLERMAKAKHLRGFIQNKKIGANPFVAQAM